MGSFYGKYLRNKFPIWMEINKNSASNGAILLDVIGKYMEESLKDCHNNLNSVYVFSKKPNYFNSDFYSDNLNNYMNYNLYVKDSYRVIDKITCLDNETNQSIDCFDLEFDGIKRFFKSYSDSLTITNIDSFERKFLLYKIEQADLENPLNKRDIVNIVFYNRIYLRKPQKLYLIVKESTYIPRANKEYIVSDLMYVVIRGYNKLGKPIEDQIEIKHPGIYQSNFEFSSICNIGNNPAIERSNFNAEIEIVTCPVSYESISHDYKSIVRKKEVSLNRKFEKFDSSLILKHDDDSIYYLSRVIDNPRIYVNEYQNSVYQEVLKQKIALLADEKIEDIEFDIFNDELVAITNLGYFLKLSLGASQMKPANFLPKTFDYDISFETYSERYTIEESLKLTIFQGNIANKITKAMIIIQRPNGSLSFIKNKNGEIYENSEAEFITPKDHIEIEKMWQVINYEIKLDEEGQWNFYSLSLSDIFANETIRFFSQQIENKSISQSDFFNKIKMYIDKYPQQKSIFINSHSIYVENNTPSERYQVSSVLNNFEKYYIYQDGLQNEFFIIKRKFDGIIEKKKLSRDKQSVLFDKSNGSILFHKKPKDITFNILFINNETKNVRIEYAE